MEQLRELVKDLEDLNQRYLELNPKGGKFVADKEQAEKIRRELFESGNLIPDFYREIFVPRYSDCPEPMFRDVDGFLCSLSYIATQAIEKESFFGLSVLLLPKGSQVSDSNLLESLIERLKA